MITGVLVSIGVVDGVGLTRGTLGMSDGLGKTTTAALDAAGTTIISGSTDGIGIGSGVISIITSGSRVTTTFGVGVGEGKITTGYGV